MTEQTQEEIQAGLRADGWQHDPQMEAVLRRLERNPDDAAVAGTLRMAAGMYREGKQAAQRAGRDVTGGDR
jgi:hypothetical protein